MQENDRKEGPIFWTLGVVVTILLLIGLALRASPGLPDALGITLESSLIPVPYFDLVGLGLFLSFLYAATKRNLALRLAGALQKREREALTRNVEIEELSSVFEVSSRVNTFSSLEDALEFIARSAMECLGGDRSSVLLVDGDMLVLRAAAGRELGQLRGVRMPLGGGIAGWVAQHHRPLLLNSPEDVEAFLPERHPDRNISSALSVPLLFKGESLGVLNVSRLSGGQKEPFQDRHLKLLTIYADYASSALNNIRMYRAVTSAHARLERSFRDLKLVQDQLIQAEKMSAVGQLISEVSHELNNPLTTVLGYAQLVAKVNKDPEIAEYLSTIRDEGLRCQSIIRNLLDFARKQKGERVPVEVNEVMDHTLNLRRYQLGIDGIEVEMAQGSDLPTILADPTSLQQVLLNLLNNAHHAVMDCGRPGWIRMSSRRDPERGGVAIEIEDNGPGIPDEYLERVFDPFYTTKEKGKGTGLGLSVCRGIVQDLGGRVIATRGARGGALLRVTLPAGAAQVEMIPADPEVPAAAASGKRILIVDDDARIREMLDRALRLDDHRVLAVASGAKALDALDHGEFDLILSDVMMPGMSGMELYESVSGRSAEMAARFIFLTGVALSEEHRAFVRSCGRPVIQKPFRLDELRRAILASFIVAGVECA
jgi:signal transduction histidine kinase/ActR/RegA family two-component response regulator